MDNLTLKLRGMSCASCASSVEQAIQSVSGVIECHVNFGMEQATIQYDSKQTDLETIQSAVDAAGYQALPLQEMAAYRMIPNKPIANRNLKNCSKNSACRYHKHPASCGRYSSDDRLAPAIYSRMAAQFLAAISADITRTILVWQIVLCGSLEIPKTARSNNGYPDCFGYECCLLLFCSCDIFSWFLHRSRFDSAFTEVAASVVALILLGKTLENRAKGETSEAIRKLMGLQAKTARIIRNGEELEVPIAQVEIGDVVQVRPESKSP